MKRPNEPVKRPNEPKTIPLNAKHFEAKGVKYYIHNMLSVERWEKYEEYQHLAGFGTDFQGLFELVKKAYLKLNERKDADAAVTLHNIMVAIKQRLEKRDNAVLMICALWCNSDDEDTKVFDEQKLMDKIQNWREEGYAMSSFFTIAWNLVPGFIDAYKEDLEDILNRMKEQKKEVSKEKI